MTAKTRKPWTDEETTMLIEAWDVIGSITLLSVLLNRSRSSIQTQASRVGLPRRTENLQRHRRRWSEDEELDLQVCINKNTNQQGKIRIDRVALEMDRSVDAIIYKLTEEFGGQQEILKRIYIPNEKLQKLIEPDAVFIEPEVEIDPRTGRKKVEDTRSKARMRNCLTCQKPFYSEGAHNRICDKCTRAHDGEDWYGGY